MTVVYKDCSCCGGDAGRWDQFWNQDYEYGICTSCAIYIANREGWDSVFEGHGVPGRNWRPPTEKDFEKPAQFGVFKEAYKARYGKEFAGVTIFDNKTK